MVDLVDLPNFSNNASQIILVNNAILVVCALRNVFSLVFTASIGSLSCQSP